MAPLNEGGDEIVVQDGFPSLADYDGLAHDMAASRIIGAASMRLITFTVADS